MLSKLAAEQKPKLLLSVPNADISQYPRLAGSFGKYFSFTKPSSHRYSTKEQVLADAETLGTRFIATTSFEVFKLFDPFLKGTQGDNTGSVITCKSDSGCEYRICLLPFLSYQFTKAEGVFLIEHFLHKLSKGTNIRKDKFSWQFVRAQELDQVVALLNSAFLVAVDIETVKEDRKIISCSYTAGFFDDSGNVYTRTFVVECNHTTYPFCISALRRLNKTRAPKVMQNGKYDSLYFLRFGAPLYNYIYDTYNMFHSIYQELPKDLSFLSAFLLDNYRYWKDEAGNNIYEYNAKDAHNTFWAWLASVDHMPEYAVLNYCKKFKLIFPCLSCELEGQIVDVEEMQHNWIVEDNKAKTAAARLQLLLNEPNFNPGSPVQVAQMFKSLGYTKAKNTSELETIKFGEADIFYQRIAELITEYRGAVKARGTYFELELLDGKLYYALDPNGTETGRMASKSSSFWCGTQIQNIPEYARGMVVALPGWSFAGIDKAQSESYCTAYISQDLNLISAVTTSPDFHCHNASMFFRIPFDQLYDVKLKKVLMKAIRKLAKPINHGANYNMGAETLVNTIIKQMGSKALLDIKALLKLPAKFSLKQVAQKCLDIFDATYPRLRSKWYNEIQLEVVRTGKLVIPGGYTRRTFLQPTKSKLHLNACVAHKPQSLSVDLVNEAFYKIWTELQLKKYRGNFRLKKQVHDEIVPMVRDFLVKQAAQEVADMMVIPTVINGRTMTIPSTIAIGKTWGALKD